MQWEFEAIVNQLILAVETRQEYDCEYLELGMFQEIHAQKAFVFNNAYDRVGRPIFWLRFENWKPEVADERETTRYFCWSLD